MGKEDVELTFNPQSFIEGVKKMTDAMNTFENRTKDTGKGVDKNTNQMSSFMVAKGTIMAHAIMAVFQKVFNFIKTGLPELGKTFSIASDIIQRNLLWPLRKELAPMLQKVLDWTRDHRAMFVRWGGALVNVFRAIGAIVQGFFKMISAVISPVAEKLKSMFGGVAGGIGDVFNIVLFKITAVIMFLQVAFMPIFKKIGDTLAWAIGLVESFFEGFSNGISGITGPFMDLLNQFQSLLDLLTLSDGQSDTLYQSFKVLGDFVGTVLYSAISGLAQIIDGLVNSVKNVVDGIAWAKAKLTGTAAEADAIQARMDQRNKEFSERSAKRAEGLKNKWSDFDGRTVAEFHPTSKTSAKQINASSKVTVEKIEIKVDKGTDPIKAGEGFIEGMNKKTSQNFKNIILSEQAAQGV